MSSSSNPTHSRSRFSNSKRIKSRKNSEAILNRQQTVASIKVKKALSKVSDAPSIFAEEEDY